MNQIILSLITGIFISAIAGYIGSLMITKRMALVGGPLGHLALPGVALALIYNFGIFFGALLSIAVGAFFIWLFSLRAKLPIESLTAIVFAAGVAIGFLFLPLSHAEEALIGDITRVNLFDTILAIFLSSFLFIVIRKIYSKLTLSEISEDLAKSMKIDVRKYNLIYLTSIALVAAMEVKIVGILLTAALLAIPAAASRNFSRNIVQYSLVSVLVGSLSAVAGIFVSYEYGLPAGPLIILISFGIFLISLIPARKV
ncbi:MAG: metal ABC transporter permease [Candidatus Aenigmarchaeota archaeon]|nr:metal ABC transporter permease [Candidatus Aenigmarchaeota archaeon]